MTFQIHQFQTEAFLMSAPSNGITAEVIREIMPPYHLSDDLLQATFAALAPPGRDASTAWRHARIRRLTQEISTLMPANATHARLAADILMVREMANTIAARIHAPELTVPEMCRVGRVAGELVRTAAVLVRTLERGQQKPAPFFGTVLADAVDVAALDAAWGRNSMQRDAVGDPGDLPAGTLGAAVAGITPGTTAAPGEPPGHVSEGSAGRAQASAGLSLPTMAEGMGTVGMGKVGMGMGMGMGREITDIAAVQPSASGPDLVRPRPDGAGGDSTLATPAELSDVAARFRHDACGRPETGIAPWAGTTPYGSIARRHAPRRCAPRNSSPPQSLAHWSLACRRLARRGPVPETPRWGRNPVRPIAKPEAGDATIRGASPP
jgi:hypothetical protein